MTQTDDKSSKPKRPKQRRFFRRVVLWVICVFAVVCVSGAGGLIWLSKERVSAPEWLRVRIEQRINNDINGFRIRFGDLSLILDEEWAPRLRLLSVSFHDAEGAQIVHLTEVHSRFALQPLMRGELRPSSVRVSGARVVLRRTMDGAVGVSVGERAQAPLEQATGFGEVIEDLNQVLQYPHFEALKQVEADNLSLLYEDARTDKIWSVDGGRITLARREDDLQIRGDFALLGARDYATTLEVNYSGPIGGSGGEFGISFEDMPARDISGQFPALTWLQVLEAPISGALRSSVNADNTLGPLNATLQIGPGALRPTDATRPIAFSSVRSYFTYDPGHHSIEFTELSLDSKWISASAEGKAQLNGMEDGQPDGLSGQILVKNIRANPADMYPEPVAFESAGMDVRLRFDPFDLSLGQLNLRDQDKTLVLDGSLRAEPEGWDVALNGQMDGLKPERLMELWPKTLKENTRTWIENNVIRADLTNMQLAARLKPNHKPDFSLGFDFGALDTRFLKTAPPIQGASGRASIYDGRFVITADKGYVMPKQGGRIDVSGTSFIVPDIEIKKSPARVFLKTDSTITGALSLLDEDPFNFLKKAGQPVTLADGRAQLDGQLDFLLIKKLLTEDVSYDISGTLTDVRSEILVKGRVLASPSLMVEAANGQLRIGGKGRLGQVPFWGDWEADLDPQSNGQSRVRGTIELSERFADEFRIGLPAGTIRGAGDAVVEIDFEKNKPDVFRLSSDLNSVGLAIKTLNWSVAEATLGTLEVSGILGEPPKINTVRLIAPNMSAEGSVTLHSNGQLDRAEFTNITVGQWLSAPVDLIGRGVNLAPAIVVKGGKVDIRKTTLGNQNSQTAQPGQSGSGKENGPVTLSLDELRISDAIALTNFRADLSMVNGVEGSFVGEVNGETVISGTVTPQDGRSAYEITSDDAGGVLQSTGLVKSVRDGSIKLKLTPADAPGSYNGKLRARDIRVKDAPGLAALLNALSIVGLLEQLGGSGIHFAKVDAEFLMTPEKVTLYSGSATGASMGISMDGYYHTKEGKIDMEGVVSPFYLLNAVGGVLTRPGEGLIGIAYKLKGSATSPRVKVNPLSALTPGVFRELFRRPAPRDPNEPVPEQGTGDGQRQPGEVTGRGNTR